ncbi:MAG: flagellar hook protein FlgE [Actinobacteria bacterium]|nr:flagellar hook protein FlgE [Actinomycetota bacterium]
MIRSMFSAISGLRAHRTMLDVVGNNISNTSTAGFKSSATVFEDVLSETLQGAGAGAEDGTTGGTNPSQIGLGVSVARISTNFSQGALQNTGRELDFAIRGDGFFAVESAGARTYTRAGSMSLDADGRLVSATGGLIQGWSADGTGQINTNVGVAGITVPVGTTAAPNATTDIALSGNLPADATIGDTFVTGVEIYNSLGDTEMVALTFENTAANEWTVTGTYGDPATAVTLTDNVVTFDATTGAVATPADFAIDLAAGEIPDFGAVTISLDGDSGAVTQFGGLSTLSVASQDGFGAGILQSISMSQEGVLVGSFSNGINRPLAQLAIANFTNPEGLEKSGGSMFSATINSGDPQLAAAGNGGRGLIASGTLEMSNVDLAQEFVTLITAQRGFQANSRVVTSSDEVLSDIVNLKR